jgi:uncharacterized protein
MTSTRRPLINFHVGASDSSLTWFGDSPWPSFTGDLELAMGSSMIYLSNAKVIGNIIYSGLPNRFPKLKFVSVESGRESLEPMIERVGIDNVMFQTDFPHATCLYPDPL